MTKDKPKTKMSKETKKNLNIEPKKYPIWLKLLLCGGIHEAEVSNVVEGVERPNCHYILDVV